jgi:hypothetical protein
MAHVENRRCRWIHAAPLSLPDVFPIKEVA